MTRYVYDREGGYKAHREYQERLPEFFQKFPQEKGWRREIHYHSEDQLRGLPLELYGELAKNGTSPEEAGLPKLRGRIIIEARLINPEGHIHACGSSIYSPDDQEDEDGPHPFKAAETNAESRLLMKLGVRYDADLLDPTASDQDQGAMSLQASGSQAGPSFRSSSQPDKAASEADTKEKGDEDEQSEEAADGATDSASEKGKGKKTAKKKAAKKKAARKPKPDDETASSDEQDPEANTEESSSDGSSAKANGTTQGAAGAGDANSKPPTEAQIEHLYSMCETASIPYSEPKTVAEFREKLKEANQAITG